MEAKSPEERSKLNEKLCDLILDREFDSDVDEIIDKLVSEGVDINYQTKKFRGNSPIHLACHKNDAKCVKSLLKFNLDLDLRNYGGETVFDIANKKKSAEIIKLLTYEIDAKYIRTIKFPFDFAEPDSPTRGVIFKILKLTNCFSLSDIYKKFLSPAFQNFLKKSSHLFVIVIEVSENDLSDVRKSLQEIFEKTRPWIVQVAIKNIKSTIYFRDAHANHFEKIRQMAKLGQKEFLAKIRGVFNFHQLMQGIQSGLIGYMGEKVPNIKMFNNKVFHETFEIAAAKNTLCLKFLMLFKVDFQVSHLFNTISHRGVENLLAILDLPIQYSEDIFLSKEQIEVLHAENGHGRDILIRTVETNNVDILRILLKSGFEMSSGSKTAANIAWTMEHYECLRELLTADCCFPDNFNPEKGDFQEILEVRDEFHKNIRSGSLENVKNFVESNPKIKIAYNTTNSSAITIALKAKQFKIYSYMLSEKFTNGIDENFLEVKKSLTRDEKRIIRKENKIFSPTAEKPYLTYLLSKTNLISSPDEAKTSESAMDLYYDLDEIEDIQPILRILEECEDLKISIDFSSTNVKNLDPDRAENDIGCYHRSSSQIYIGAKDFNERFPEILSVLAHELTHYAIESTYLNNAKPYCSKDFETQETFSKIVQDLKNLEILTVDPVISNVFKIYPEDQWEAELIARVPHLYALYNYSAIDLVIVESYAKDLPDFFRETTLKDIEAAKTLIKPRKMIFDINSMAKIYSEIPSLGVSLTSSYNQLEETEKIRVIASNAPTLSMVMVLDSFFEMFGDACDHHNIFLKLDAIDEEIMGMVREVFNSDVNPYVVIDCAGKIETCKGIFNDLLIELEISNRIILIITEEEGLAMAKDGEKYFVKNFSHYWVDLAENSQIEMMKKIVNFQGKEISLHEMFSVDSEALNELPLESLVRGGVTKIGDALEKIAADIIPRNFLIQSAGDFKFENDEEINVEKMIEIGVTAKKILISDIPGSGKSHILNKIAHELKTRKPDRWVSIMNLKSYKSVLSAVQNLPHQFNFLDIFKQILFENMTNLERRTFDEHYLQGQMSILLDGFDEVYSGSRNLLLDLVRSFEVENGNQLWITARSHIQPELESKLNTSTFSLQPLTRDDQIQFLIKNWNDRNDREIVAQFLVDKITKIRRHCGNSIGSPLLLDIISQTYDNPSQEIDENLTISKIYAMCLETIFTKIDENGEDTPSIMQIHQSLAIRHFFPDLIENFANLDVEVISKTGLVKIENGNFQFTHETFAEFLAAKYMISKFRSGEQTPTTLVRIFTEKDFHITRLFLNDAVGVLDLNDEQRHDVRTFIRESSEFPEFLSNIFRESLEKLFTFLITPDLDLEILKKFLLSEVNCEISTRRIQKALERRLDNADFKLDPVESKIYQKWYEKRDNESVDDLCLFVGHNLDKEDERFLKELCPVKTLRCLNLALLHGSRNLIFSVCRIIAAFSEEEQKSIFQKNNGRYPNALICAACNTNDDYVFKIVADFAKSLFTFDEVRNLMLQTDTVGMNVLVVTVENQSARSLDNVLRMLTQYLTYDEIYSFFEDKVEPGCDWNCFQYRVINGTQSIIHQLFNFADFYFRPDDLKNLIIAETAGNSLFVGEASRNPHKGAFDELKKRLKSLQKVLKEFALGHVARRSSGTKKSPSKRESYKNLVEPTNLAKFSFEQLQGILTKHDAEKLSVFNPDDVKLLQYVVHVQPAGVIEEFFEKSLKNLDLEDQGDLLTSVDANNFNILHYAMTNKNPGVVGVIFDSLSKILDPEELKDLITVCSEVEPIVQPPVFCTSPETIQDTFKEVGKILKPSELFELVISHDSEDVEESFINAIKQLPIESQKYLFTFSAIKSKFDRNYRVIFDRLKDVLGGNGFRFTMCQELEPYINFFDAYLWVSNGKPLDDIFEWMRENLSSSDISKILKQTNKQHDNFLHKGVRELFFIDYDSLAMNLKDVMDYEDRADFVKILGNSSNTILGSAASNPTIDEPTRIFSKIWKFIKDLLDDDRASKEYLQLVVHKNVEGYNALHTLVEKNKNYIDVDDFFEVIKEISHSCLAEATKSPVKFYCHSCAATRLQPSLFPSHVPCTKSLVKFLLSEPDTKATRNVFGLVKSNDTPSAGLLKLWSVATRFMDRRKIFEILSHRDSERWNVAHIIVRYCDEKTVETFFKLLQNFPEPEKLKPLLTAYSPKGHNLIALSCLNKNPVFPITLNCVREYLNTEELFETLSRKDSNGWNAVHCLIRYCDEESIESFFKFLQTYPDSEKLSSSLTTCSSNGHTLLALACYNDNPVFDKTHQCVRKFVNDREIKEMFLSKTKRRRNAFQFSVKFHSPETIQKVFYACEKILDPHELFDMMTKKEFNTENILHVALENKFESSFEMTLEILRVLFRNRIPELQRLITAPDVFGVGLKEKAGKKGDRSQEVLQDFEFSLRK